MAKRSTGGIGKAYRTLRKKAKGLVTLSPKKKFYYAWFYKHCRVNEKRMLFESFHGKNVSDSTLAVLQEMVRRGIADEYEIYYGSMDVKRDQKFIDDNKLPVKIVDIESRKYVYVLATAKYLLNNSSFPIYFIRRPEQVYVQTWHGTPLKTLGKQMRLGIESMYNVQHNFIQASMVTFPNEFTRECIMRDYNLKDLYTGSIAMVGYPRNAVFMQGRNDALRKQCGLDGIESIAYMPTWRGTSNHNVDIQGYAHDVRKMLKKIDKVLDDSQRMYVNFHSMVADSISLGEYRHIEPFPKSVGNYDFLSQVDVLITDYSSVFFDYALTRRPIVLFAYDLEEYTHDRGFYLDFEDLPFTKIYDIDALCAYLKERGYQGKQPDRSGFDAEYLPYDSKDNAAQVLDLLLERYDQVDVPIIDCAKNAQKTWRAFDVENQKNIETIDGIMRAADPERDIVVLNRTRFNEIKSAYLHDNFLDSCNYLFITRTLPRTYLEDFTKRFSGTTRSKLEDRERTWMFGGLNIDRSYRRDYISTGIGSSYSLGSEIAFPARVELHDDTVIMQLDAPGFVASKALLVRDGTAIAWEAELENEDDKASACARYDVNAILEDPQFVVKNNAVMKAALLLKNLDTGDEAIGVAACSAGVANIDDIQDRTLPPVAVEYAALDARLDHDALGTTGKPLVDRANGREISVLPYYYDKDDKHACLDRFCLRFTYTENVAQYYRRPDAKRVSTPGGKSVRVDIQLHRGDFDILGIYLVNRMTSSDTRHPLKYAVSEHGNYLRVMVSYTPAGEVFDGTYWDLALELRERDGRCYYVQPYVTRGFAATAPILNRECNVGDGHIVFPYATKGGKLAFIYRERHKSDVAITKVRECAAFIVFAVGHAYWARKRLWLVYEKFCSLAQDNGYYFFEYCMEHAPQDIRKNIYYVIDKDSPEYERVKKYDRNVVDFMSFRHMLYVMVAKIYIASDARSHLYQWRPKPSLVQPRIAKHKIFFLQHGVTAMKRVDYLFGMNGSNPM
ncbi:MAG: CDP-glycerol glycerophosphotransferase family protein, partial [Coriobacteriia bacterium]|nr:CDP-glycerol glycerophosphotransferase family protein [Coriobacteriia bacterium]